MAALGYRQLDRTKRSTRLLSVTPDDPEDQIRCQLTHADLAEHPSFIALSYTWDQGGGLVEIDCCGTTIQVGKNLRNFLYRFRIWDAGRGIRLWIDALCMSLPRCGKNQANLFLEGINQNDIRERNHQVTQMRALYLTATSTIAWLGETNRNTGMNYAAMYLTRSRLTDDKTRRALIDVLNRPYWSRVWVIQEFLLPSHLDVWWDSYRIKASDLRQVVWTLAELPSNSPRAIPRYPSIWNTPGKILLHYRESYQRMRNPDHKNTSHAFQEMLRLRSLLHSFSASQCTVTHDGLYALLGVASDATDSSHPILPDYNKSLEELFLDLVRNQYGAELEHVGDMWDFVNLLCNLLRLSPDDVKTFTFMRTWGIKRDMRPVDCRLHAAVPFDWKGYIYFKTSSEKGLEETIAALGRDSGCLAALEDYLECCRHGDNPGKGTIKEILRKPFAAGGDVPIWHWTNMFSLAKRQSENHIDRHKILHKVARKPNFAQRDLVENISLEGWAAFSGQIRKNNDFMAENNIVGITRTPEILIGHDRIKIASYRWFGRFGAAVLMTRQKGWASAMCHQCRKPKQSRIIGTAFIYEQNSFYIRQRQQF